MAVDLPPLRVVMARSQAEEPDRRSFTWSVLTPHANAQRCKKIRRSVHSFGNWADPKSAMEEYNQQAADLHAGRQPALDASSGNPERQRAG